jgi:hypothetical protein
MLGRNSYTRGELDSGRKAIAAQLASYDALATAVGRGGDKKAVEALAAFEPMFFDNLTLALDRFFVHRVRAVSGKDGNPLNEVELLCESLMENDGSFRVNKVIKHSSEDSVLGLAPGDRVAISRADFERLSSAFFGELESRFL